MQIIKPLQLKQLTFLWAFLLFIFLILPSLTQPVAGASLEASAAPWKFAVISDTQDNNKEKSNKTCLNNQAVQAIAEDIAQERPDFVFVTGDLVNGWFRNGGTDYQTQYANWKAAMAPVYQAGISVYPIRGNHDSGPERLALPPLPAHLEPPADTTEVLKKAFQTAFTEPYIPKNGPGGEEGLTYSFVHKNVFIVGLDQYTGGQHKVNQAWLDRTLAGNRQPYVFIFGHEPAFGAGHPDNLAFFAQERDLFWNSIGKAGAKIYFCGHDHFYNRALISDAAGHPIRQIIAGTGGGPLKTWPGKYRENENIKSEFHDETHHGYVLVTVDGPRVTVTWKALANPGTPHAWQTLDTFMYSISDTQE